MRVEAPEAKRADVPDSAGMPLSGIGKASVLLISLGADLSSAVLQQMSPDEVERLTAEIVRRKRIRPELKKRVLEDCRKALYEDTAMGGHEYAREVLEQVFGESKAREVLSRLSSGTSNAGAVRTLQTINARQLAQGLRYERPQIVALVLGHLAPDHAAQVISSLPEHLQGESALRLTMMQPTDPDVVNKVSEVLLQQMKESDSAAFTEVGGNDSVVRILNNAGRSTEKKILEYLQRIDEGVAERIKEKMFVFEDILNLDDRSIQVILRDVPQDDMRLALKGSPETVRDVFFRNMSQRAAETLQEDLEASGPVKLRDVEAAQSRIVNIARQLDEAGEISLRASSEDMIV